MEVRFGLADPCSAHVSPQTATFTARRMASHDRGVNIIRSHENATLKSTLCFTHCCPSGLGNGSIPTHKGYTCGCNRACDALNSAPPSTVCPPPRILQTQLHDASFLLRIMLLGFFMLPFILDHVLSFSLVLLLRWRGGQSATSSDQSERTPCAKSAESGHQGSRADPRADGLYRKSPGHADPLSRSYKMTARRRGGEIVD